MNVRAVNGQSAVTACRVMPQSRTWRWPTRPPWQQPRAVVMAMSLCRIALPWMLVAMKAAANGESAMDAEMTAAANVATVTLRAQTKRVYPVPKRLP